MIISGDLFDQHNRTLRAEVFLKEQFERLKREQIMDHDSRDINKQIFVLSLIVQTVPLRTPLHAQYGQIMFPFSLKMLKLIKQSLKMAKRFICMVLVICTMQDTNMYAFLTLT
jgi:hypothetical protein